MALFSLVPSVPACTSVRSGLRAFPSLSLQRGFLRCLHSVWARIVILIILASLAVLRWTSPSTWHTARDGCDREGFSSPAPSVLACTSVRTGLRTFLSVSTGGRASSGYGFSDVLASEVQGPVPTICSRNCSPGGVSGYRRRRNTAVGGVQFVEEDLNVGHPTGFW